MLSNLKAVDFSKHNSSVVQSNSWVDFLGLRLIKQAFQHEHTCRRGDQLSILALGGTTFKGRDVLVMKRHEII